MKINELYNDVITEDSNNEYKASLNPDKPIKWAKTLIGYANGKGGTLYVGVSNDGEAFGLSLDDIDKTKNLIAVINDRHIFPHIKFKYMMISVDENAERFVLAVYVSPSDSIIRYREGDFNETVYIKGDGNAVPATPEDIISLSKKKYGVDNETSDIKFDPEKWSEYVSLCKEHRYDYSIPTLKELQNEDVVSIEGNAKTGLLMFMDDYNQDDTMVCCRLWSGKDKVGTVLDTARYIGSLAKVFSNALNFIERNTKTGWRKTVGGGREEVRSYPREAIREALVNAIAHRDYSILGTQIDVDIYSDRIEIVSPGSWLLPQKYDDYPIGSIPSIRRNKTIAACLDIANLMERGGTGFQTMVNSYSDSDVDIQPVVSIYPGFLNLKLYDKLYNRKLDVSEPVESSDQKRIIECLKNEGAKSVRELQALTKYSSRSRFLEEVLNPLFDKNVIYRDGNTKSPKAVIKLR